MATRIQAASRRRWSDAFAARYARSSWRLPLLLLVSGALLFGPMYLLRGVRLVRLGGLGFVALAAAAVGFAYPFQTLLLALFIGGSGLDLILPGHLVVGLLLLVLVRLAYDLLDGRRLDWGSSSYRISLVLLSTVALTSMVVAQRPGLALPELRLFAAGLAFFLAISLYADRPGRVAAVCLTFAAALPVAVLLNLRLVFAGGLGALPVLLVTRFGALDTDPNLTAAEANCAIGLLLAAGSWFRGWVRWLIAPVMILLIGTVIVSQSRSGMLLLALMTLGLLVRVTRRGRGLALFGAAVLAAVALILPRIYWVRFVSIAQLSGITVDRSLLLRQHALKTGWAIFWSHPWLGVGFGNFTLHSPHYMLRGYVAHNTYIEVAATLGIVGLAAYVAWLWAGLSMARQAATSWSGPEHRRERGLAQYVMLALLLYYASAMTLSIMFYTFLWIMLGLANATRLCAQERSRAA